VNKAKYLTTLKIKEKVIKSAEKNRFLLDTLKKLNFERIQRIEYKRQKRESACISMLVLILNV